MPQILELHTSQNTGALWGFGATIPGSSLIFAGLSVVAAVVILYYLFVLRAASSRALTVALGLIMAGAMGNCYDRLAFGHVRDCALVLSLVCGRDPFRCRTVHVRFLI